MPHTAQRQIGHGTLTIETGKLAAQADSAVTVRYGDTLLLATACAAPLTRELDFFPFTEDYEERLYAAGRIPGSFFRREGRPTQDGTLTARLTRSPWNKALAARVLLVVARASPGNPFPSWL